VSDDLYCKVYLKGPPSLEAMRTVLTGVTGVAFDRRTLTTGPLIIDLLANVDGSGEDFVTWPFYLEIDATTGAEAAPFIAEIRRLLTGLQAASVQTVPSCDFEDQLRTEPCP
jgi:hypothetical protein